MDHELAAADELFVNGVRVSSRGSMPPHAAPARYGRETVADLPAGVAVPGTTAVVAYRLWYPPFMRQRGIFGDTKFAIGESSRLHLARRADHLAVLIAAGPGLALNSIILFLGFGLLILWRWAGGRELLFSSVMLISMTLFSLNTALYAVGVLAVPWWAYTLIYVLMGTLSMGSTVEFVWTVHDIRNFGMRRVYRAAWIAVYVTFVIARLSHGASPLVQWSVAAWMPLLLVYNCIQAGVNLWALVARRRNRLIAVVIISISVTAELAAFNVLTGQTIGPFYETYFGLAFFVCDFVLFLMLGQRAWQAWRAQDELRAEFEAAREVQQRLVAPAVRVPGFRMESVYAPAKQVGGDFFRVLPESDGSVLVVVGDVSGKGLKAAMTVSTIMGALRGCPSRRPAEILAYLNRVLYGQVGGFVTCCASLIELDGTMTLANAGNPAPYRNGEEMAVESGLHLGLLADVGYEETSYKIAPHDRLTFVSDGVLEATNAKGELYGFERTRAISAEPAERVAEAAQAFGQEDDITVLSVMFTPSAQGTLA